MIKIRFLIQKKYLLISMFGLFLIFIGCSNKGPEATGYSAFDSTRYDDLISHFQYTQVMKELYPVWKEGKYKSISIDAYLSIAASRKARFFKEANQFDKRLGIDAYQAIKKFEKVQNTKYHFLFSAIYYYLSGDNAQAIQLVNRFVQHDVSDRWKHDARIFKAKFKNEKIKGTKISNSFLRTIFNSFPESEIDFDIELKALEKGKQKHIWMTGPLLQHTTIANIQKLSDDYVLGCFDAKPIFKEKIAEIKLKTDSLYILYTRYYNPLLLGNLARFYQILAQKFFQKLGTNVVQHNSVIKFAQYEYAKLLLSNKEYGTAKFLLNNLLKTEQSELLKTVYKIDLYYCKIALKTQKPDFTKMLAAFKKPILQSYFIYRMADLGYFLDQSQLGSYFKFNDMSKGERLTCSEYIGNYYLLKKEYDLAQNIYQRRLLGGSYDIKRNEHIFLLKFIESYYHNKINLNLGNWGLRNLMKEYPELVQLDHNYALINASNIFK